MFFKKKSKIDENMLYKDITQDVVMSMMSMRVINTPELKFFTDDKGVVEDLVKEHITDKEYLVLKKQDDFTYMFVCGMHAFGAGVYTTLFQTKVERPVDMFTLDDRMILSNIFSQTDSYELGLKALGLDVNSNNKKVFDQIIINAIKTTMSNVGKDATSPAAIRQLMKVLFNAGITVVMK